jgi:hypothetical protein
MTKYDTMVVGSIPTAGAIFLHKSNNLVFLLTILLTNFFRKIKLVVGTRKPPPTKLI